VGKSPSILESWERKGGRETWGLGLMREGEGRESEGRTKLSYSLFGSERKEGKARNFSCRRK